MSDAIFNKKREGLTQQAYRELKLMILNHRLKPGMVVNEAQLQEALNIGRTPVREAVLQLSKEHFLVIHPRHGIEIAKISPKRIKDIFGIRSLLEPQILRNCISQIDKAWLRSLLQEFKSYSGEKLELTNQDVIRLSALDNEFHMGIIKLIDNNYANELMASFQDYLTLFRVSTSIDSMSVGPNNLEHNSIIEAILNDDVEEACLLLENHLTLSYEQSISIVMNTDI